MSRPRSVPEKEALDHALRLFWDRGYDRCSIADLGAAIGVGPSSLYNTFGSKANLFRRSLLHYKERHAAFLPLILEDAEEKGVERSVRNLLDHAVRLYTKKGLPHGCAILQGGGSGGSEDSEGAVIAKEFRKELEKTLRRLFDNTLDGDRLAESPRILSKYILGIMRGLSQLAADGTSRTELLKVADHAAKSCLRRE